MKLRTLLIDDELIGRKNLELFINEYTPDLEIVASASSGLQGLEYFEKYEPEVIFLDIKMPGMNGFEFLEKLPHRDFHLVITTAHNEYGIKAVKQNAIDYLEKPLSIEELEMCVSRIIDTHKKYNKGNLSANIERLISNSSLHSHQDKISVPTKDGYAILQSKDIIHLQASESYTMIHVVSGEKYLSSKNIRVYEEKLSENTFFRTHKSHIINYHHHLKGYERKDGNVAILSNDKRIPIARRKMANFLEIVMR